MSNSTVGRSSTSVRLLALLVGASAALAQTQSFEFTGTVVDSAGTPVPSASVWINQDRMPRKFESDSNGRFTIPEVRVGTAELVAWKEHHSIGGLEVRVAGPGDVTLQLGEPDVLRLHLIERVGSPGRAAPSPPVPVAGARIQSLKVSDAYHVSIEDLVPLGFPARRSDDDGRLEIEHLPKGGFVGFRIAHRTYSDVEIVYYPVGQKELTIDMHRGVRLRGRAVTDANESVEGARVSVFRVGANALKEFSEVLTGPEGYYSATLPPGEYYVMARHPRFATPQPVFTTLPPDQEEHLCDLSLTQTFAIRGSITDDNDHPLGGVSVQYVVDDVVYDESWSVGDGSFTLRVCPIDGRVHVVPPDGFITEQVLDIPVSQITQDVSLERPLRLTPLPEIAGAVLDPQGNPAKNVVVSSMDLQPMAWTVTDAAGHFRLKLARAPVVPVTTFRAEHALRFARADFQVDFGNLAMVAVALKEFEPDLSPCDPEQTPNKLDPLRGNPAPEIDCDLWFNLPAPQTASLSMADLRGKVVVLNFWGSFDRSDQGMEKIRILNTLHELFRDTTDVVFVGIHDSGSEESAIARYLGDNNIHYPVGRDRATITYDNYDIYSLPQTILVDKQGVVRFYDVEGRLLELIKALRREA